MFECQFTRDVIFNHDIFFAASISTPFPLNKVKEPVGVT